MFDGHFKEDKVLPGVYLIEGASQAALLMEINNRDQENQNEGAIAKVDVRFFNKVLPGDLIEYRVNVEWRKKNMSKVAVVVKVGQNITASGNLILVKYV